MDPAAEAAARKAAVALEATVGHPGKLWKELQAQVTSGNLKKFADAQDGWLRLMWCLDAYKAAGIPPVDMGQPTQSAKARLDGVYRTKGNWFATLLALLLRNRTGQIVGSRTRVQGMSQLHQIDLAWPDREVDPLVCVETKVMGGPAYGNTTARGALSDFSNRRKELKFAATDLKLWRRQQATAIRHWGEWRREEMPKTYFLWAARLKTEGSGGKGNDSLARLIQETDVLIKTYLDGAGIFAWRTNATKTGYEPVAVPAAATDTALDDVLYRIESVILKLIRPDGTVPPPETPTERAVEVTKLAPDVEDPEA